MSIADEEAARAADDAALAAAEALAANATPGPWSVEPDMRYPGGRRKNIVADVGGMGIAQSMFGADLDADNAEFIAASREGWPEAVAIARRLQAENKELREKLERVHHVMGAASVRVSDAGYDGPALGLYLTLEAAITDAGKGTP